MDFHHRMYNLSLRLGRSKFFCGLEILLSSVLGITLVFPVLGILLALNELLRFGFKVYLWLVYDDSVKLNDDVIGTNYIRMSPKERHTVLYLGELEGTLDVETIREKYQKHVIENKTYDKMSCIFERKWQYVCMKKDKNFDIKNHIRYYPGTEERTVTEKELMAEILPNLSGPFEDTEKPQWEEVIIPFYEKPPAISTNKEVSDNDSKTISLRIIRMHHCYMDGACTLIMIANTFTDEGKSFPYVIDPCKPLKISKLSVFLYKLTSVALFSSISLRYLLMPPFMRGSRFEVHPRTKGKVLFGWTNKIHMDVFKSIKDKSGVSMPAIVSTVLSGAIRKLEMKYPRNQGKGKYTVPDTHPMWLVAGMFPYAEDKPTNEHIVIETQINTADISCCERLAITNDDLGRLARNPMVTVYYWFAKIIGTTPHLIATMLLSLASCPAILSNIPLCTRNFKMWGRECYSIVGWVPLLASSGKLSCFFKYIFLFISFILTFIQTYLCRLRSGVRTIWRSFSLLHSSRFQCSQPRRT